MFDNCPPISNMEPTDGLMVYLQESVNIIVRQLRTEKKNNELFLWLNRCGDGVLLILLEFALIKLKAYYMTNIFKDDKSLIKYYSICECVFLHVLYILMLQTAHFPIALKLLSQHEYNIQS